MVATNTDTGTPGASDSRMPPTAETSAKTTEVAIAATGATTTRARPTSEAVEATAAILDESQTGAVYDAIVKRYGIQGKLFTFVSKLRGGMRNNIGLELKVAESETG